MKLQLRLINIAILLYLVGLLATIGIGMRTGAIMVILSSSIIGGTYIRQLVLTSRQNKLLSFQNLLLTLSLLIIAIIYIHGFSLAIDMPFLGGLPGFSQVFLFGGIILVFLFLSGSILSTEQDKSIVIGAISIVSITSLMGLLGMSGLIPVSGRLIFYAWVFLLFFFLVYFLWRWLKSMAEQKTENMILFILTGLMILFWILRFNIQFPLQDGFIKSIVFFGFVPLIVLPIAIQSIKGPHFFTIFILYFIFLDFYFIHMDSSLNYLVRVGGIDCVGYEDATNYPINYEHGIPPDLLFKEPSQEEKEEILKEWANKDFSPGQISIEYASLQSNGDSLLVISHYVNKNKHYGLVRIPKNINKERAPILLGLMGGGTGIDVLKTEDVFRQSATQCRDLLSNFITIMPSYRGNIVRGDNFCFRSEGYAGDVWLGPTEDALTFLEAVKQLFSKGNNTRVLARGVSRGATVALIAGSLTNKIDYIVATSTHTNFLDAHVLNDELVGRSYPAAFFTPEASSDIIRKRILASSPYYFAEHLPAFELHQGAEDQRTTVYHAEQLKSRIQSIQNNQQDKTIYIYPDQGHAYDDNTIVCEGIANFLKVQSELEFNNLFDSSLNPDVACYRIPSIVTAPNSDLIVAIDERLNTCGDLKLNDDINIVMRKSKDNGKSWSDIETIVDYPKGQSASDPSMIVDKVTGEIFLFFNYMNLESEKDIYYLRFIKSADNGITWTLPIDITNQITKKEWHKDFKFITSGRGIQTSDGRLLHTLVNLKNGLHVFGSDDHGNTWYLIDQPITPGDESKLVELSNGDLMINSRVNGQGFRYVHTSSDGGNTWVSEPDSTLIDPGCNASIVQYTPPQDIYTGSLLLFSNANSDSERVNLSVRVSHDDGKSWTSGKTIYSQSSAYSSMTVLDNGDIGLMFEKDDYQENVFVKLSLDWITSK